MKKQLVKILWPLLALALCAFIVLTERNGVIYREPSAEDVQSEQTGKLHFTDSVTDAPECMMLVNGSDRVSLQYQDMMQTVLDGMKIGYRVFDVNASTEDEPFLAQLNRYKTVVLTFEDWSCISEEIIDLCKWVKNGGQLMNTVTPSPGSTFKSVYGKLGIEEGGVSYVPIKGFTMLQDCMIGAKSGQSFEYEYDGEGLYISLDVELNSDCTVYMKDMASGLPLMWSRQYGSGKFVMLNEALTEKFQRGFLSTAYSLLDSVCIYPVINASAFYIDDFPSPIPSGNGKYIKEEYGVDINTFYSTIWWPTLIKWEQKYGIKHTGMIIEDYNNNVQAPFTSNNTVSQFVTFGNVLLNNGGELGIHGYNHQPICLEGIDNNKKYGEYKLWKSEADVASALREVYQFSKKLFPSQTLSVYVPPSNIISEEGIRILEETLPNITTIASTYLQNGEGIAYAQEFGVEANGIVNTPRVVSGCDIDHYQQITALSELNFHYVQSHFLHPDDVLDEDRGAALGWETLSSRFDQYLNWIYTAAPDIRDVTGSQMSDAVVQYDRLSLVRSIDEHTVKVQIGGFSGEAHFVMRLNEGSIEGIEGCSYQNITGNLYIVHAQQEEITIHLK